MRNVLPLLAAGLLFTAPTAHAVSADFENVITLQISGFDAVSFSGGGTGDTTPGGGFTIPADSIVAGFVSRLDEALLGVLPGLAVCEPGLPGIPSPAPAVFPIPATPGEQVADCAPLNNGSLDSVTFDGGSEGVGGLLATAYLTNTTNNALVSIPLVLIGVGGVQNFSVLGTPATLTANPWTTDEVTVTGGLAADPPTTFTDSGFDNRDPVTGLGQVKLVTTALTNLGSLGTVPAIATLTVTFAPEPGSTAAGLAAIGVLAVLSRRARRS